MLKKNIFFKFDKKIIFFLSLIICITFYVIEDLIGINKFYHPDSLHYISPQNFPLLNVQPKNILDYLSWGYYFLIKWLNYNYELTIFVNFILYSLTNVIIFEKIFKKLLMNFSSIELVMLFYLLFLDPYRLHLACHILKETVIIFVFSIIIFSNSIFLKVIGIILSEFFRKGSSIYLFIFFRIKFLITICLRVKKFIFFKKKINLSIVFLSILSVILIYYSIDFKILYEKLNWQLQHLHYREFPNRDYDKIYSFNTGRYVEGGPKDPFFSSIYYFYEGLILKIITWGLMFLSGSFLFFTSSILFKILGVIIIINHIIIYKLTKKTYVDFGLICLIILIVIYSGSYTAFYRYSYLGMYFAILDFFYRLKLNEK